MDQRTTTGSVHKSWSEHPARVQPVRRNVDLERAGDEQIADEAAHADDDIDALKQRRAAEGARATADQTTASDIIREALRRFLDVA